jgi:hypothetical protein
MAPGKRERKVCSEWLTKFEAYDTLSTELNEIDVVNRIARRRQA